MTNFDNFLSEPKFTPFAEVAVSEEKILNNTQSYARFNRNCVWLDSVPS